MKSTLFYIIGNWKSNKTIDEAVIWAKDFETFAKREPFDLKKVRVILCVPFLHMTTLASLIELRQLPLLLGAQNVSAYPQGAYTGETSASMCQVFVKYTLIGHSERRKYFKEDEPTLKSKLEQAKMVAIEPVYCVQDENMSIPETVTLVGYEPVWAIGTGKPDTPDNANRVAGIIKQRSGRDIKVIYGGSVTPENVTAYATMEHISGVLPGGASLTAQSFHRLIVNASKS